MSGNHPVAPVEEIRPARPRYASDYSGLPRGASAEGRDSIDRQAGGIIEGPIPFTSPWENQVLPFFGRVYIGYVARDCCLDIAGLTRLVRLSARRFTDQELIGRQIAEGLIDTVQPQGVAVYLEVHYLCDETPGVLESIPVAGTTVWCGEYETDPHLREDFFNELELKR